MTPESRLVTAFSTPDGGNFECRVIPFGLRNASAHFQQMMAHVVLAGYLRLLCLLYMDDIIVYSETYTKHLENLGKIFERLQQLGLVLSAKKCDFSKRDLSYLI